MSKNEDADILAQGTYTDIEPLPESGQRQAYRVKHLEYGTIVVKIGSFEFPEELERIKREVMLLRQINSAYYPKNYGFRVISDQNKFVIEEEYIPAPSLDRCTGRFTKPIEILQLMEKLVEALNVLWEMDVVHRDVKPGNILILADGAPRIIDLGVARLLYLTTLTDARGAPCTRIYAAPEQIDYNKIAISYKTDQFPLGIVMLQLLLKGEHPFEPKLVGEGASIVDNIRHDRWCREDSRILPLCPIASNLLGHKPYMRYRRIEKLLAGIKQTMEELR